MDLQYKKKFLINTLYYAVLILIFAFTVKFLFSYLLPVILAIAVATFVQSPSEKLKRITHTSSSLWSVLLVIVVFCSLIAVAVLLSYFLLVFLRSSSSNISLIGEKTSILIARIEEFNSQYFYKISPELSNYFQTLFSDFLKESSNRIAGFLSGFMTNFAGKIPNFFFAFIVSLVAGCYVAKDYNGWVNFIKGLLSQRILNITQKIKTTFKSSVLSLIKGYLKLCLITFAILFLGLMVLNVRHTFIIAFFIAVVDLMPIFGTGTVLLPWSVIGFLYGNYYLGTGLIILYIIVVVVRNFAEPKVVGTQIGINPLLVLISMFVGIRVFGVLGLIILPVTLITVIKYYKEEM